MGANEVSGLGGNYFAGNIPAETKKLADAGKVHIIPIGKSGYIVLPKETLNIAGLDLEKTGDTRADDVITNTSKMTTVDLSSYDKSLIIELQTSGVIKTANADFTKCEVAPGKEQFLNLTIGIYNSLPQKMDEVVLSGDPKVQEAILSQLMEQKIADENGNIVDKTKLADLLMQGIKLGDKTYKFSQVKDGEVDINYNEVTETKVESKFKEMNPALIDRMKAQSPYWKEQLKELEKQGHVSIINGRYFTNDPRLQKPQETKEAETKAFDPTTLVGNEEAIDAREIKLQEDFFSLYDTNPDNAMDTLLHTKYYKEYKALEDALIKMNTDDNSNVKNKDYGNEVAYRRKGTLARAYYAQSTNMNGEVVYEYASPEEVKKFQEKVDKYKNDLSKQNIVKQIDEYKTFFGDVIDDNIDSLSEVQLQQLAEAKAYNEGLTDSQIKNMASTQFKNRFNTEMNNVYRDYNEKINEAQEKGDTKKVEKLQRKMNEEIQKIADKKIRTENEDRGDYAAMMARGQVNSEIAEGNFKKTTPTYESITKACPEAKEFIEANKQRFYKKDAAGQLTNEFDPQAWKDFWLNKAASREDNNTNADNKRIQDYYMSLGEAEDIVRGNATGTAQEAYVGLGSLFEGKSKDKLINLARDMAETAGVVTEDNKTAGLRAAHVLKETAKGAAAAAAADVLGNFVLSKIKIPYAGQLAGTVTGSVNWAQSGTIQDLDTFVSRNYQNGVLVDEQITNQIEEHDWFAKGTENYSQDYLRDFSGDQKLRSFTFDPWAIAVGGVGGAIKGLIDMKKIHDKEDKNSRIQQYARRDLNTSPVKETATKQLTQKADTYKYVAQVEVATEPVEEKINNKKCRLRARHFAKGNYNMADSKKDMVATYYGIAQNDPNFNKIYEYIMEQINGLKKGQYNDLQYVNNMTYFLPEKLPSSLTGLDKDYELKFDPEKDPQELDDVKIELGGSYTITGRNNTQTITKPGENAAGSITAQRRKREV